MKNLMNSIMKNPITANNCGIIDTVGIKRLSMQTFLCAIYNSKTGHFSPPLIFNSKEHAVTSFIAELNSEKSELKPLEDSLKLFCLGRYDVTSAKLNPYLFKKLLWSLEEGITKNASL